jgi:hypothetical protein
LKIEAAALMAASKGWLSHALFPLRHLGDRPSLPGVWLKKMQAGSSGSSFERSEAIRVAIEEIWIASSLLLPCANAFPFVAGNGGSPQ